MRSQIETWNHKKIRDKKFFKKKRKAKTYNYTFPSWIVKREKGILLCLFAKIGP
jgi:hypothetical protein